MRIQQGDAPFTLSKRPMAFEDGVVKYCNSCWRKSIRIRRTPCWSAKLTSAFQRLDICSTVVDGSIVEKITYREQFDKES